jgi:hypothetical protein
MNAKTIAQQRGFAAHHRGADDATIGQAAVLLLVELSDRIRRLALQNTGCTTGDGTASVHRSLTVLIEA